MAQGEECPLDVPRPDAGATSDVAIRWAPLPFAHLPNAWLLFALLLQVVTSPFLEDYRAGRAAMAVFDLVILALALRASHASGHETRLGYVLVVPAMVLHAVAAFSDEGSLVYSGS